jgi:hypothetical protein
MRRKGRERNKAERRGGMRRKEGERNETEWRGDE